MSLRIGIRLEDKNRWERRVPLVPADLARLAEEDGLSFIVQPSTLRIFADGEFASHGVELSEDLSGVDLILAVKEVPIEKLLPGRTYLFFAHVVKGQRHNMRMLQAMLDKKITLIDYERILDEKGRRLVFFGRHAGQAGMIETLHALGKRYSWMGHQTPLADLMPAYRHADLADAQRRISVIAGAIAKGLPEAVTPLVVGFAGYGNVSQGAQEILDLLPHEDLDPGDLESFIGSGTGRPDRIYRVVFKEEHMVEALDAAPFDLQDYYKNPGRYRSVFHRYLPLLSALVNCIYWTKDYPRLVTKNDAKNLRERGSAKLQVIGDISCDIEGSIEFTNKATEPDHASYVYDAVTDRWSDGVEGDGIAVMAVDNLPCELPRDASNDFSRALRDYIPALARTDFSRPLGELGLPPELMGAVITHQGELTPSYRYLEEFLLMS